ncbi:MAG: fimbrillin family protein [Tannerella sp.]|nr:fimbrillin family protein [Tannerella sp.]
MEKRSRDKMNIRTKNSRTPRCMKERTGSVWHGMLYLLLLAGASACVMEDVIEPDIVKPGDAPVPVTFRTATALQTRAGDTGGWATDDRVGIFMLATGESFATGMGADNREYLPAVAGDARTATLAPVTSPVNQTIYYPVNGNVDFVAYCPYRPAAELGSGYACPVDVSDQTRPEAIDLRYAKASNAGKNTPSVTLVFDHQLSRVTVNVKKAQVIADDFSGLTAAIHGVPSKADFSLEDRTLTPHSPASTPVSLRKTVTADGYEASFEAILVPQAGTAGRKITLHAGSSSYTWDIPETVTFETGKHHIYDLSVSKSEVNAEGRITPWVNEMGKNESLKSESLNPGTLLLEGYTGNVTVTYKDDLTPKTKTINVTSGKAIDLPAGSGTRIIRDIILEKNNDKTPILIGRKGDGKIVLKVTSYYSVSFRSAVNGNIPIGSRAELDRVSSSYGRDGKYLQEDDIDMMDISFQPIGYESQLTSTTFTGIYDGGGKKIRNLAVSTTTRYVGLFGYASGSSTVIRNVHIVSGNISGDAVGGICGYALGGATIENCSNRASVKGESAAGGIAGHISNSKVTACYNAGAVTVVGNVAGSAAGGITGTNISATSVIACYNTGNVTGPRYAGGISGGNSGTPVSITACYSTGNVSGGTYGGICGSAGTNAPANCYWTGNTEVVGAGSAGTTSRKFGDGSNNTGWPAASAANNWGIASGSNAGKNGYYWKSLGSYAWNTYPQLWWED